MERKRSLPGGVQKGIPNDVWLARAVSETIPRDVHDGSFRTHAGASLRERVSIRKPFPCHILVDFGTTYAIASNIRDISLSGAFVDLNATGAQEGDAVEVVIAFEYKDRQIEHRIPATIARVQHQGIGLKFDQYDDQTYTDLVNFLYAI
jgi:hypothetical protein